jgi:hypothetical protein
MATGLVNVGASVAGLQRAGARLVPDRQHRLAVKFPGRLVPAYAASKGRSPNYKGTQQRVGR